jgi:hypothetical protein
MKWGPIVLSLTMLGFVVSIKAAEPCGFENWIASSSPSSRSCAPRLALHVIPAPQLQLWGVVGRRYRIEYAPAPHHPPPWPVLTEISSLPFSPYTIPDTTPSGSSQRFYRAALLS